ncbi:MAG: hypothetical protein PGN25_08370 [Methylorubrum populi]
MRNPIFSLSAALALSLLTAGLARAQGMPGATVGLPMGSPDPFGLSTVNRPAGTAEPFADPSMDRGERRIVRQPQRRLKGHRHATPKRRVPTARR